MALLTEQDLYLFNEGTPLPHLRKARRAPYFGKRRSRHQLSACGPRMRGPCRSSAASMAGIQVRIRFVRGRIPASGRVSFPESTKGTLYKFHIVSRHHGHVVDKADPFGFFHEKPPAPPRWFGISTTNGLIRTG